MGRMSGDEQGLGAPLPYLIVRSESEQGTQARALVQDQRTLQGVINVGELRRAHGQRA